MAVYRVEKTRGYTVMANYHLRDERLTLKAKGLLSLLLSLPDDWKISLRGLSLFTATCLESIQGGIRELTENGYITRSEEQAHDEKGRLAGFVYTIHEAPCTEKPYKEKPYKGFPDTLSTELLSTNIPPIAPQEEDNETPQSPPEAATAPLSGEPSSAPEKREETPKKRKREKKAASWEPVMFERFWKCYPRGEDKQGAIAEWDKLKPDRDTMLAMSRALKIQMQSEDWLRGVGIPYAVRWLRHRRWEDEARGPIAPVSKEKELPVWN